MARYYFDIHDGDGLSQDKEGLELPDTAAVQEEAVRRLSDVAREKVRAAADSREAQNLVIEVRDDNGPVIYARVRFDAERLQ